MLWKLRLFWYHADKAGLAFAIWFVLVVGGLLFGLQAVYAHRDA